MDFGHVYRMSYLPTPDGRYGPPTKREAGLLTEADVYRRYEIDPNALYSLDDVKKKTGIDWYPLTNWAAAHKAWRGSRLATAKIPGDALVLYIRIQRWKEVKECNTLLGLRPPAPIPVPQCYETSVQRARRERGSAYKSGRKSRAQWEKEAAAVVGTKTQILARMTRPLWELARKHGIIPEKLYKSFELAKKLGISTVKFWRDRTGRARMIRRHKFGKYYRVLGLDYLDFLARQNNPLEIARLTPKETAKAVRLERSSWPPLTREEYKIARECRIRPGTRYDYTIASERTGFPIAAIDKWAKRLRRVEQYGSAGRSAYVLGRDLIFFLYERRWRANPESVGRYPDTPPRYQTEGYQTFLHRLENRKHEERRIIEDRAKAAAKAEEDRRREERRKELERLNALRTERSFSSEPLTKERYTIKEVAALANRERKTVERWIKMGWVKTIKIGRHVFIEREEVARIQATNGKPWVTPRGN
jgi:excisionase family DNA binding protein